MKTEINLLSSSQLETKKEGMLLLRLRLLAIVSVVFVCISSIIVFIIIQSVSPSPIEKKKNEMSTKLSVLRSKQAKLILVNQKIKDIEKIVTKRSEYKKVLSKIIGNLPAGGASVNSMSISEQQIEISVGSNSLSVLDEFINNFLTMANEKDTIKNLTVSNMSLDAKSGQYTVSIAGDRI